MVGHTNNHDAIRPAYHSTKKTLLILKFDIHVAINTKDDIKTSLLFGFHVIVKKHIHMKKLQSFFFHLNNKKKPVINTSQI